MGSYLVMFGSGQSTLGGREGLFVSESGINLLLAERYRSIFVPVLEEHEVLLNAGSAIQIETSEQFGRNFGDGILGFTHQRMLHMFDTPVMANGGIQIDRLKIEAVRSYWIALPMNRRLEFKIGSPPRTKVLNFYVGKKFCREIEVLLQGKS